MYIWNGITVYFSFCFTVAQEVLFYIRVLSKFIWSKIQYKFKYYLQRYV